MADNQLPSDIDLKVPARGPAGKDGKSPIRGQDYWTQADQDEIKQWIEDAIWRIEATIWKGKWR